MHEQQYFFIQGKLSFKTEFGVVNKGIMVYICLQQIDLSSVKKDFLIGLVFLN